MFDLINAFLWTVLAVNLTSSPAAQDKTGLGNPCVFNEKTESQENPILSIDYACAKRALDKAVSERDEATIRLGLKKGSLIIRKDVIRAVQNAYYQTFVRDLAAILEEIQVTETNESEDLKKTIVAALIHLTGLSFPLSDNRSKSEVQEIVKQSREWYRANETKIQEELEAEMLERRKETPILSKNYRVARWAFDKAISEKDKSTLRVGLKGFFLSIKRDTVKAVAQLDDKSFVPDLIQTLDENQVIMSGGSETQAEQEGLNKEIISSLKRLTGLEFSYLTDLSTVPCFADCPSKDIQRVLKESRGWCETNKKNY